MDMAIDVGALVRKAMEEAIRERGQMNVLIAGRTGAGKSTLINSVFQGRLAETGQGRPITTHTREITKSGIPLSIWDTRGLELAAFQETIDELTRVVSERAADPNPARHIHVAWLCIQEDGRRVEEAEIALHKLLAQHMPVLGVVTKARSDGGFKDEVQSLLPQARNVVRVRAIREELDEGHVLNPMGLETLIEATSEVIPDGHRRAFAAAQKASIKEKASVSHRIVAASATSAAALAVNPLPLADAALIVPVQIGMLAGITSAYGMELTRGFLTTIVASAAGAGGATYAGRVVFANLLRLFPGAGTIAGGVIAASTAAAMTTALGEAYIATLSTVFSRSPADQIDPADVAAELKRRLSKTA